MKLPRHRMPISLDTVMPAANAKNIRIVTALDEDTGPVRADSTRLQQVVWNLLSNAVKFTPEAGEVRVELRGVDPRTVRREDELFYLETALHPGERADTQLADGFFRPVPEYPLCALIPSGDHAIETLADDRIRRSFKGRNI